MIKCYILPFITEGNTTRIAGTEFIHHALAEPTANPLEFFVIMDTTPGEDITLSSLSLEVVDPTPDQLARYNTLLPFPEPTPEYLRACEILESSPVVITLPEMWELVRIFGRRLGYRF